MTLTVRSLLLLVALILLALEAFSVIQTTKIKIGWLGLAFLAAAFLFG